MSNTLDPRSHLGLTWALLLAAAPADAVRPAPDPWRIWPLEQLRPTGHVPLPAGPVVYAAAGAGRWRYVGQSTDVRARLSAHASDRRNQHRVDQKRDTWEALLLVALTLTISAEDLDAIEALAGAMLRPEPAGGGAGRYPAAGRRRA